MVAKFASFAKLQWQSEFPAMPKCVKDWQLYEFYILIFYKISGLQRKACYFFVIPISLYLESVCTLNWHTSFHFCYVSGLYRTVGEFW
jgi:hypothetical protein